MKHLLYKIHLGDCLEFIKSMPDGCVDLVLTDPPYQQEAHSRGISGKRKIYTEMSKYTNINNDWYNDDFLDSLVRVCKFPNLFLFCGKRDLLKCLNYAENNGYHYHIIPLCKLNPIPTTNNTWLPSEFSVHITDRKITHSKDYSYKIPYFLVTPSKETNHPNEKRVGDLTRVIENIGMNGVVFDPFSGSGSTAIAATLCGNKFIAVEKDPDYHAASVKRLEEHKRQGKLF